MLIGIILIVGLIVLDIYLSSIVRNQKIIINQLKIINKRFDYYINNFEEIEEKESE